MKKNKKLSSILQDMTFKTNEEEYIVISLKDLLFDERVADMVEHNKALFPSHLENNIFATDSFPLNKERLDRIISGYDKSLPPIKVTKGVGNKYIVQNGRHRVCATIMRGDDSIPCTIVTE